MARIAVAKDGVGQQLCQALGWLPGEKPAGEGEHPLENGPFRTCVPLFRSVSEIVGERSAALFAHAIAQSADCSFCAAYFRKMLVENGIDPDNTSPSEIERDLIQFGSSVVRYHGHVADHVYDPLAKIYSKEQLVTIIAFAGQLIAATIFNNIAETELDASLTAYLPKPNSIWSYAR